MGVNQVQNVKQLEKELDRWHHKNDPVIVGIIKLLKKHEKQINKYQEALDFIANSTMSMLGTQDTAIKVLKSEAKKALES